MALLDGQFTLASHIDKTGSLIAFELRFGEAHYQVHVGWRRAVGDDVFDFACESVDDTVVFR